jgi:hypothetical protein
MAHGSIQLETCPECGLCYGKWRPNLVSYSEAYEIVFQESQRRAAEGDYSFPASRRHVLAKMREIKEKAFRDHVERCAELRERYEAELALDSEVPF